jgi:hypothetical protein
MLALAFLPAAPFAKHFVHLSLLCDPVWPYQKKEAGRDPKILSSLSR